MAITIGEVFTAKAFGKVCAQHPELKGERYVSNRTCTACIKERAKQFQKANPKKFKTYCRRWERANPEKVREMRKRSRRTNWKNNRESVLANCASRRAMKRSAAVPLTQEEKAQIKALYALAARRAALTGIAHHVDHDKPLVRGGLHHPDNMLVVPASLNVAKGARFDSTLEFILS